MEKTIKEAQRLFESITCLGVEGVEFFSSREIIDSMIKEASEGYNLCKETLQPQDSTVILCQCLFEDNECEYCLVENFCGHPDRK